MCFKYFKIRFQAALVQQPNAINGQHDEATIGKYRIKSHKLKVGCVTIMHESGEGGTFDEKELEKVIEDFYDKNF